MNEIAADTIATVRFRLNGVEQVLRVPTDVRLIDLIRERFGLMASKTSCRIGRCGSCLVLVDGKAVNSCLLMGWQFDGADIVTSEGLDALPEGRAVRAALMTEVAFQCGYCAPGFTVALTALFRRDPDAQEGAVRAALAGNLCRCTGYLSILRGAATARAALGRQRVAFASLPDDSPAKEDHHVGSGK
jgi:aerobic-type carbon monoxide dehydrogenase small subunit (CoxS/CutS family)